MSFTFENQGNGSHLVYEVGQGEELETMSLGMLTNNRIPGLISPVFSRMNMTEYVKYNVSSKISVRQFFTGTVNKKQLLGVFNGIAEAMISADEYMINPNSIILDTDYIFSDVSTCETVLICLPIKGAVPKSDLKAFFREIMFNTQFDQTENCDHVAKIINFLNSSTGFSVYDFKEMLDKIKANVGEHGAAEIQASVPQVEPVRQPAPLNPVGQNPAQGNQIPAAAPNLVIPQKPIAAPVNTPLPVSVPKQKKQAPMKVPNMTVPGSSPAVPPQQAQSQQDNGENISLMYLLQHYNKENAEKYKMQKQAKKSAKPGPAAPVPGSAPYGVPNMQVPGMAVPKSPQGSVPQINQNFQQKPMAVPQPPKPMTVPQQQPVFSGARPQQSPIQPAQPMQQFQPVQQATRANFADFGETEYIQRDDDAETAFLMPGEQNNKLQPYLLAKRNGERIPITKNLFRLGRDAGFNDYVVQNNKFVGHSHCHIVTENGEYFIVDDNSKNRTFVDSKPIQPGEKVKISHGQLIKLADEEFEFKLF